MAGGSAEERIVEAFLKLLRERGYDRATTRAVAAEARVNEVTIFRRFGDKAGLARAALERGSPLAAISAYQPGVDPSTPERAVEGLARCLRFLRDQVAARPELLTPASAPVAGSTALAARGLLERALAEARLQLRPEVELRAAALTLEALVFMTALWQQDPALRLNEREWDRLLETSLRPLLR